MLLYKIVPAKLPPYFYWIVLGLQSSHLNSGCFKTLQCWTEYFENTLLPFILSVWNKLELTQKPAQLFSCEFSKISKNAFSYRTPPVGASADISNADSNCLISKNLLIFIEPIENSISGISDLLGIKLLNRL